MLAGALRHRQGFYKFEGYATRQAMNQRQEPCYFPAIVCAEFDSPIDALVSLCVPADEAMDLVSATWTTGEADCVMTVIDGGRTVAALRTAQGRWAACNAFPERASPSLSEATRQLGKLLRRGRRGMLGCSARQTIACSGADLKHIEN